MQFKIKLYLKQSVQAVFDYLNLIKFQLSVSDNEVKSSLKHPQPGSSDINNWFNCIQI